MLSGRARACGVFGVVALVAAGLVGCGGGEPAGGPTLAAKPSTSSTSSDAGGSDGGGASDGGGEASSRTANLPPENAALEAPDFKDYTGIKYETDQGAQETVRYFFDAMYYAYATGDGSPILEVGDPNTCVSCADVLGEIETWRSEGRYITLPSLHEDALFVAKKTDDYVEVQYEYSVDAFQEFVQGDPKAKHKSKRILAVFHLTFEEGRWVVLDSAWKKFDDDSE
ncbi:DUF6318 family protein [Dermabacter hominis]